MRNTFRYIIAILAGVVAFASCAKEMPGTEPAADGKERVITATFGYASKSTLDTDGLTPIFTDGDLITVTNGTATQVCTLRVSGTLSTFTTKLEGSLTAVYPRDAAVLSGNSITGVKVPSIQTGLFKDANIAKAEIAANSLSAHFVNQTAILRFYVDESIEVKSITITGTEDIASDGGKTITVDPDGEALIHTKTTGNPDPRLCYVAVLPCPVTGTDITSNNLIFTSVTNTQETVTRSTTAKLKTAGMYNAFIPYYIDMGTAGKWGYCNIGAFLPEDYGRYFMWGETVGQVPTGDTFSFPNTKYYAADNSTWNAAKGFFWENCPWTDGIYSNSNTKVFTKYTVSDAYAKNSVDNKTVLESGDDAASVNWGEKWRIATGGTASTADYTILANACKVGGYTSSTFVPTKTTSVPMTQGVYFYNVSGREGIYFVDASGHKLFFPAARGGGLDSRGCNYFETTVVFGDYFTSSLNPSKPFGAHTFHFEEGEVEPQNEYCERRAGRSIRAVYDEGPGVKNDGYEDAGSY